jgi:hypothetical protein
MYPFMPQVMYYVQDWSVIYNNAVRLLRCEIGFFSHGKDKRDDDSF